MGKGRRIKKIAGAAPPVAPAKTPMAGSVPSPTASPLATPCAAAPAFSAVVGPDEVVFAGAGGFVFGSETDDGDFGLGVGFARDDCVRVFGDGEGSKRSSKCKRLLINHSNSAPSVINCKPLPITLGSASIGNKII